MFCVNCGTKIGGVNFCPECGTKKSMENVERVVSEPSSQASETIVDNYYKGINDRREEVRFEDKENLTDTIETETEKEIVQNDEVEITDTNADISLDKEFVFEASMGRLLTIKGCNIVFKTVVNCSQDTIKFIQSKGERVAKEKKAQTKIIKKAHIVSINTTKVYNVRLVLFALFFLFASFFLGYTFILFIIALLGCTNKVIVIKLVNGDKIQIRYSKTDPYQEFLEYLNN